MGLHTTIVTKQNRRLFQVVCSAFFGGLKRIRTAVRGFADLCLATRPSDHFLPELQHFRRFRSANIQTFLQSAKIPSKIMQKRVAIPLYRNFLTLTSSQINNQTTHLPMLLLRLRCVLGLCIDHLHVHICHMWYLVANSLSRMLP